MVNVREKSVKKVKKSQNLQIFNKKAPFHGKKRCISRLTTKILKIVSQKLTNKTK